MRGCAYRRVMIELLSSDEIVRRAKERGLSIAQVCRLANINQATFQRWKNGAKPQIDTYNRVIAVIEMKPDHTD